MKTKLKYISSLLLWLAITAATAHAGSLWRDGVTDERGMVADKRAKRVGDILTVVVSENVGMTNSLNLTTNKQNLSQNAAGIEGIASNLLNQFLCGLPGMLSKRLRGAPGSSAPVPVPPTLSVNGTNSYTGGGTITNSQTITGGVAVQVVDVLPNGNLVIEGLREISFSKERQFASLHGIVRPYDIQPDNTVNSTNIAAAQVDIVSEGTLTDAQKKGWLLRLNDKINPF
jgi:flagellar L-ring protein precursor FlgH